MLLSHIASRLSINLAEKVHTSSKLGQGISVSIMTSASAIKYCQILSSLFCLTSRGLGSISHGYANTTCSNFSWKDVAAINSFYQLCQILDTCYSHAGMPDCTSPRKVHHVLLRSACRPLQISVTGMCCREQPFYGHRVLWGLCESLGTLRT